MKITRIDTFILKVPLEEQSFWSSQCAFNHRKCLLVRVETDSGLAGWGEGGQYGPAEPVATCVHSVLAPLLLGQDPRTPAVHWERAYCATRDFGRKGAVIEAISAVDIALWDLLGRSVQAPVHLLLGGAFRTAVRTYATGVYYRGSQPQDAEEHAESAGSEARQYALAGFPAVKMKVGLLTPAQDLKRVEAVRQAIGGEALLMVDANHAYSGHTAADIARRMEPYNVFWFEEPVVPEDIAGYRQVKSATTIAIAGGECEYTRFGFLKLLENRAVDIIQPDITVTGGFTEGLRIAALASAHNVACTPHVWGSAVGLAAGLHFLAALPPIPHIAFPLPGYNEPMLEWDANPNPLRTELTLEPIAPERGQIKVPQAPGLGIELDWSSIERYLVSHQKTETFHASMAGSNTGVVAL